jgi:hypothetical protein
LVKNFKNNYFLGKNIKIDESLVYFRGRQQMKFYLPSKPYKWGFKLHLLCDSNSDYVYNIIFDPGKVNKEIITNDHDSLTDSIVLNLVEDLENNGHTLLFDSSYSGANLEEKLKRKGFDCPSISKKNVQGIQKGDYNKEKFNFISTIHSVEDDEEIIQKSNAQDKYNMFTRINLHLNQSSASFSIGNKSYKWWKKIFFFLLDVVISNAIVIMESHQNKKISQFEFRKNLIFQLFENYNPIQICSSKSNSYIPKEFRDRIHEIEHTPNLRKRCKECGDKTVYKCKKCNLYLHAECFNDYHKKRVYNI